MNGASMRAVLDLCKIEFIWLQTHPIIVILNVRK